MLNESLLITFLLIMVRVGSYLMTIPFFSIRNFPKLIKVGLVVVISYLTLGLVPSVEIELKSLIQLGGMAINEAIIGLALGYACNMIFLGIQAAGDLIDSLAGLKMSSSYDPVSGTSGTLFSNLYNWIGLILFLNMDGHYYLLKGLINTFFIYPIAQDQIIMFDLNSIVVLITRGFLISVQLALPIGIIMFLIDILLGMICRAVPQINVFILGMPLKLIVSVFSFVLLVNGITNSVAWALDSVIEILDVMAKSIF